MPPSLLPQPQVVVRFVRRTADSLREYDMWGAGFSAWPDVPWRRSALQFVLDMGLGPDAGVCLSVLERLARCEGQGRSERSSFKHRHAFVQPVFAWRMTPAAAGRHTPERAWRTA